MAGAAPTIEAVALMRDRAILRIDGRQQTLQVGQTHQGVTLLSANAKQALLEIAGKRQSIRLSGRIAASFTEAERREVTISRNGRHQYKTLIGVNGQSMLALVDTGATVVAINSGHAKRLGIDYRHIGEPGRVQTAAGMRNSWLVKLDSVAVGGITARYVTAAVIEGEFPQDILLGMSYLQHVTLREANGVMVLSEK